MTSARWWSLPVGVALIVIGVLLQQPYPFAALASHGQISKFLFIAAGGLLFLLPWVGLENRRYRSFVAMFGAAACASRAATLIFVTGAGAAGGPTWQARTIGAIAWCVIGNFIAATMVSTWPPIKRHQHPLHATIPIPPMPDLPPHDEAP